MKITRRNLFQKFGILSFALILPKWLGALTRKKNAPELVILHTNDTHSHIDPLPAITANIQIRVVLWRVRR
jgi:2',3'-cyclic-nucleotide 2'-phosphodiesterase (5'-nucleotidase family)